MTRRPAARASMQTVLIRGFLAVAAVSILFLSVQRYLWLTGDLLQHDLAADRTLARSVTSGLARYMSQRIHAISAVGEDLGRIGLERQAEAGRELETFRRRHPMFSAIVVTDATGVVRVAAPQTDTTGKPNTGKRFDDREWFQRTVAGAPATYDLVISRGNSVGQPALPVVAPVRAPGGAIVGVVAAALDLKTLRESIHDVEGAADDRIVVVDARGRVIVHPMREWEAAAKDLSGEAPFRTAQREAAGSVRSEAAPTGATRWASYTRLPATGWIVWVPRVEERWGPKTRALAQDLALSALVALLIAAAAAVWVSRSLSRPLRTLVDATREVAAGRFDRGAVERPDTTVREFDELFAAFGTMTRTLRTQYEELETKVAERTRALEASATEAQATAARLRAQDEIRRGYAELAALLNSLDRSHVLEEGTKKIAASLGAPLAAVYLTDDGPDTLQLKTYTALDGSLLDASLLRAAGLPQEAARRSEPVVVTLPDRSQTLRLETGAGMLEIGAVAAIPLAHRSRVLGVLVVALFAAPTEEVRSFLDSAARQLSVALSNAGLFESVRYQSQQLEQLNIELRSASEVKSQFLASMSHELRTPLNSIIGFTEVLLESRREPLSERQRTALEKVHGSGRHLLGLINDVLDLSKIEAGRMDIRPERFALPALVAECLAAIEPQAQARGLALSAEGVDAAPVLFQDRSKLKQVLVNLLSNAVKFTDHGRVTVRIEPRGDTRLAIAVADTGRGIRAEDRTLIFEAFRQVRSESGANGGGGTGLGLAITRRLTELLGGTITLESEPGRGSVFTVVVPTRFDPPAAEASLDAPRSGPRVLVIDDDRDVADIIRRATSEDALAVEWAASGPDGLARARRDPPAAIVLDVMLQDGGDGWEVLAALKRDPATRGVPVVVHSAIDNRDRARALGAEAVLVKPAAPAGIAATLRGLVRASTATGTA